MINKNFMQWLGGFFDGEGCISIVRKKFLKSGNSGYELSVSIGQVKRQAQVLKTLKRVFGGYLHERQQSKEQAISVQWTLRCEKAEHFLRKLKPFLKIKKDRAALALKYRKLVLHSYPGSNNRNTMIPSIRKKLEAFYNKMRRLNKKGPHP